MTIETVRAEVAELLGTVPADDENLLDAGLDSIRLMALAQRWQVPFVDLAEEPTVAGWAGLVAAAAR